MLRIMIMILVLVFCALLVMRVLAIHDVAGDEVMHDLADDLNASHAAEEASDHDPGGLLRREATIDERALRGGEHAVQGREELGLVSSCGEARAGEPGCTITPKLRLSDADKKESLSCILKSFFPGNWRMRMSTQMMEAPKTHAMPLSTVMIHPRSSFESAMLALDSRLLDVDDGFPLCQDWPVFPRVLDQKRFRQSHS